MPNTLQPDSGDATASPFYQPDWNSKFGWGVPVPQDRDATMNFDEIYAGLRQGAKQRAGVDDGGENETPSGDNLPLGDVEPYVVVGLGGAAQPLSAYSGDLFEYDEDGNVVTVSVGGTNNVIFVAGQTNLTEPVEFAVRWSRPSGSWDVNFFPGYVAMFAEVQGVGKLSLPIKNYLSGADPRWSPVSVQPDVWTSYGVVDSETADSMEQFLTNNGMTVVGDIALGMIVSSIPTPPALVGEIRKVVPDSENLV